ncbi:class I SAM-dependent methyltransferase [Rhodopila sp.]|uniref:class I SAM-dependent methyltransferase n=1 Tax=Rhodopila sp. TaxID=2480087 RepID=UPI003D13D7C2
MTNHFGSADYWDARYRAGGTSGAGSYGRLADYKAALINGVIEMNGIAHVADFGCGDGNLLSMLRPSAYTGLDVSDTVIARCVERFPEHVFLPFTRAAELRPADLCLSIDVIYHLTEPEVFAAYMAELFAHATRLVVIYASNMDQDWPAPHVRHRRFTNHVTSHLPAWRLCAHLPNPYPYDPASPDDTSFADFFVYARARTRCVLPLPMA